MKFGEFIRCVQEDEECEFKGDKNNLKMKFATSSAAYELDLLSIYVEDGVLWIDLGK